MSAGSLNHATDGMSSSGRTMTTNHQPSPHPCLPKYVTPPNAFVVQDRDYLSARRPGDAYLFGRRFIGLLEEPVR